jgi:hypothetical protein
MIPGKKLPPYTPLLKGWWISGTAVKPPLVNLIEAVCILKHLISDILPDAKSDMKINWGSTGLSPNQVSNIMVLVSSILPRGYVVSLQPTGHFR